MTKKKKSAKQKPKQAKKPAKKGSKKPAKKPVKASKRPAKKPVKASKRPVKPPRKPAKPVKLMARKAIFAKLAAVAKQPATEKKVALRPLAKPGKPVSALKIVPAAKASPKSAIGRFQLPNPTAAKDKPRPPVFNKDYMNPRQIEVFRKLLLDWKRSLMEEVVRTVHHMQDEASNFPDPNDRATQEEEFALELRTRDRERKLIKKIDEALISLDGGDYGYCEICGVEIGIKRLEARPTATLCIDCKNLEEIKERQYG